MLVFSWDALDNAATAYEKLVSRISVLLSDCPDLPEETDASDSEKSEALREEFAAAMDNDLNTSLAVTALYDVLKSDCSSASKLRLIADFDSVLSLDLLKAAERLLAAQKNTAGEAMQIFLRELKRVLKRRNLRIMPRQTVSAPSFLKKESFLKIQRTEQSSGEYDPAASGTGSICKAFKCL